MTAKSKEVTAATYTAAGKRLAQADVSRDKAKAQADDGLLKQAMAEGKTLKLRQHPDRIAPVLDAWLDALGMEAKGQNRASRKLLLDVFFCIPMVKRVVAALKAECDKSGLTFHRMRTIRTGLTFCRKQINKKKPVPSQDAVTKYLRAEIKRKGKGGGDKSGLTALSKNGEWSKHFGKNPTGMQQTAAFAFDKIAALIADEGVDDADRATLKDALDVITSYNWSKTK